MKWQFLDIFRLSQYKIKLVVCSRKFQSLYSCAYHENSDPLIVQYDSPVFQVIENFRSLWLLFFPFKVNFLKFNIHTEKYTTEYVQFDEFFYKVNTQKFFFHLFLLVGG